MRRCRPSPTLRSAVPTEASTPRPTSGASESNDEQPEPLTDPVNIRFHFFSLNADHTLEAAWGKVCRRLEKQIDRRKTKQAARIKSNRQQPISRTRWSSPSVTV